MFTLYDFGWKSIVFVYLKRNIIKFFYLNWVFDLTIHFLVIHRVFVLFQCTLIMSCTSTHTINVLLFIRNTCFRMWSQTVNCECVLWIRYTELHAMDISFMQCKASYTKWDTSNFAEKKNTGEKYWNRKIDSIYRLHFNFKRIFNSVVFFTVLITIMMIKIILKDIY